nr:2-nitropropane dioxygenase [Desulfobacteraceae bacterium]
SKWAINDDLKRIKDFQIWCGPSMGAFNEWAKGSFLENPDNRQFETVAMNLLFGACIVKRRQMIVQDGISLPPHIGKYTPLPLTEIKHFLTSISG